MEFPTPEIEQELQRIRAALVADKSSQLQFIGENASSLQLYLLGQATLMGKAQPECADIFKNLLARHENLALDLQSAQDIGIHSVK